MSLWNHQQKCIEKLKDLPGGGIFMDMGSGKTATAIELIQVRGHKRILIACPKTAVESVWCKQLAQYMREECIVVPLVSELTVAERASALYNSAVKYKGFKGSVIWVTNYHGLIQEPLKSLCLSLKLDCVIADEGHILKSPGGSISRLFSRLGDKTPYRLELTGTPMTNDPLDIYGQYRFLNKGVFGTNYGKFRDRYCTVNPYSWKKTFINQDELRKQLYTIAYRVRTEDVIDLPPYVDIVRGYNLNEKAREVYEELERELIALLEDGTEIEAANRLVLSLRTQQITSGIAPGTDYYLDSGKMDMLQEVLSELDKDEPVVIFCRFKVDIKTAKDVCENLGRTSCEISGNKNQLVEFHNGSKTSAIVQIQAGSTAIDLSRARYCIFVSTNWSYGDYEQARRRVLRPGQTRSVVYVHLIANNTVDGTIANALISKKDLVEAILDRKT